jgi:tetratricopeptide (TPR) repeat protein
VRHSLLLLLLHAIFVVPAEAHQTGREVCDRARSSLLRQSGREAFNKHHYEGAARTFSEALQACPDERDILLEISEAQARLRQFDLAIGSVRQFLRDEPASGPGRVGLANIYLMAQRFSEAKREAEDILKKDPGEPAALKIKANAEYLLGNTDTAERTFIELLDRRPEDEEGAYMLGRIYYEQGRIDYAAGQFERVLRLNPHSYKAFDNLGLCYEARGEHDKAIRYFLGSIKIVDEEHNEYDWPFANLAELFLKDGEAEKAFALASRAADRNPYSARNFYLGGKALCQLNKTDLCLNWLQRSAVLDPNYPEPLYLLAQTYRKLGQDRNADESEEKFRQIAAKQSHKAR